jgi:hypothetical protein
MFINHSTPGVLEATTLDVPLSVISVIPSQTQQLKEAYRVALEQINNLKQQNRAFEAKNLVLEHLLDRKEKTEDRFRSGYKRQISGLIQEHDLVLKSYRADIDRLTTENQTWKKSSFAVGTQLTNMLKQISEYDVVIGSYRADNDRLKTENQFLMNAMLNQNTRHKEELATYKIVSIGVVALCSLYPLASKFCTTETARMIANGAVQLCSALKRGPTGVKADQLV